MIRCGDQSLICYIYISMLFNACIIKLTAFSKKWLLLSMCEIRFPAYLMSPTILNPLLFRSEALERQNLFFCSAKSQWFDTWPFLHYDEGQDVMFCHTCVTAFKLGRIKSSKNAATAFVSLYASKQYSHA